MRCAEKGQQGWPGSTDALPRFLYWIPGQGFGRDSIAGLNKAVIEVERRLEEMTMEWMTRFALILFVRMIARAEQAMLLARSARADGSAGRSFCRPLHGSHHASRDVPR